MDDDQVKEFIKRGTRMKNCSLLEGRIADLLDAAYGEATTPEKSEEVAKQIDAYYKLILKQCLKWREHE